MKTFIYKEIRPFQDIIIRVNFNDFSQEGDTGHWAPAFPPEPPSCTTGGGHAVSWAVWGERVALAPIVGPRDTGMATVSGVS